MTRGRMIRRVLIVAVLLLLGLVVLPFATRIVLLSGVFVNSTPHFAGACEKVYGAAGAEDITIDPRTGRAFISSHDRRQGTSIRGSIYMLDLAAIDAGAPIEVTNIAIDGPADFYPHGISLLREGNETYLFAINHSANGGERVERFQVGADGWLTWQKSFTHEDLISPNDLAAVSKEAFYFSNDQVPGRLFLRDGELMYYENGTTTRMERGVGIGNGVQLSRDGREVYFAATTGRRLYIYDRNLETGALTKKQSFVVPSGLDNIEVDDEGQLWIAGHPKMFRFLAHLEDDAALSPSQIFRVDPSNGVYEEIYYNEGEELSASATGAVWRDFLLIGTVFDPHFLLCRRA